MCLPAGARVPSKRLCWASSTNGRIIETDADVAEGAAHLAAREPRFAAALALTGPLPLRRRPDGFETLFSAIVSQQVSTAAATAIWNRLAALGATHPEGVLAATDEALRTAGLSRQKIAYGRAIAASGLDFSALRALPEARGKLIVTPGIRPAGAALGDQKRIATPAAALAAGADHLVVARPIVAAPDPRAATRAIRAEIAPATAGA